LIPVYNLLPYYWKVFLAPAEPGELIESAIALPCDRA